MHEYSWRFTREYLLELRWGPRLTESTVFRTKMAEIDTLFMTKMAEKPYPLGPHIPV